MANDNKFGIQIGLNGRFFPENWRPTLDELAFAEASGFQAMQFVAKEEGLDEAHFGASFGEIRAAFADSPVAPVMEILLRLGKNGRSAKNNTPLDTLHNNLPAIRALGCTHVHWHLTQPGGLQPNSTVWKYETWDAETAVQVETALYPQLAEAVQIGKAEGFTFGLEHNAPDTSTFFHTPERMAAALTAVSDLGLVWDFNHPTPDQLSGYKKLARRVTMLHLSDAPLPKVNWHLPVGEGSVNFADCFQPLLLAHFSGAAILEIGGTPWSGGFGQDTDEALLQSKAQIEKAIRLAATVA